MNKRPTKCQICGISQKEIMEICFLPICPTFQLRQTEHNRRQQKLFNFPQPTHQPEEGNDR